MVVRDLVCILTAYLLGGICTGYYLVRWRAGVDIRDHGSGGVGARNVGRLLGKSGFVVTLIGDALKGVLAVLLARLAELPEPIVGLTMVGVITGHIWPLPLQFRGGRGIATALGACLIYDPGILLLLLGITLLLLVFRRGFILSGLAAFALLPFIVWVLKWPVYTVIVLAGCSAIILYAHRERLRKAVAEAVPRKEA